MKIIRNTFRGAAILMFFVFCNSATATQIEHQSTSKTATDFCNHRKTSADRSFCLKVFESDPRSVTATNFLTLLKIASDSSIANAKKTREFLVELLKRNATQPGLKPVVEECISAYDGGIGQWEIMVSEYVDDRMTSTYDGLIAIDELSRCKKSLEDSKISKPEIAARNEIAFAYGNLCEDLAHAGVKS